jgi:hypothetical protein
VTDDRFTQLQGFQTNELSLLTANDILGRLNELPDYP